MRRRDIVVAAGYSFVLLAVSCSKSLENRVTGTWQLEQAFKRQTIGTFNTTTGYESGLFHLDENGQATYIEGTDTLTGYWSTGKHNKGIYDNSSGSWQARDMRFLRINVANPNIHRSVDWNFDDIDFHSNNRGIRAMQYTLGVDRIYEFRKR